jgi:hypothetical protein
LLVAVGAKTTTKTTVKTSTIGTTTDATVDTTAIKTTTGTTIKTETKTRTIETMIEITIETTIEITIEAKTQTNKAPGPRPRFRFWRSQPAKVGSRFTAWRIEDRAPIENPELAEGGGAMTGENTVSTRVAFHRTVEGLR